MQQNVVLYTRKKRTGVRIKESEKMKNENT